MHETIIDTQNLLASVFEAADIGISIVNKEGIFVEVNKAFCELYGYSKDEIIGNHFSMMLAEEFKDEALKQHDNFFENKESIKGIGTVKQKDGTEFAVQITAVKIFDTEGKPYRVTTIIDISDRKYNQIIQTVLLEISQAASIANSPDELYKLIHDYVGKVMPVKNFYIALFDEENDTIKFPYLIDEIDDEDDVIVNAKANRGITAHIIRTAKVSLFREVELRRMIKKGDILQIGPLPKVYLGAPLMIKDKPIGVMALQSYDDQNSYNENDKNLIELISGQVARVVERKKYEEELIIARQKAEEANRIKSEFLAQMSHEIRTPINSILSFTSLIRDDLENVVSEDLVESFDLIERGGKRLIRTIDLILNVAQLQSGKYKVDLVDVDLEEDIILPLFEQFEKIAKTNGVKLLFKNNTQYSKIVCDYYSINQLFINLIDNALKYTLEGHVKIQISKNNKENLVVDIIDTGIGISEEYLDKIFEIFTQEESGYSRKFEGTGLGLSLVRQYAKLNNAEVLVESKKGKGSKFSVVFN